MPNDCFMRVPMLMPTTNTIFRVSPNPEINQSRSSLSFVRSIGSRKYLDPIRYDTNVLAIKTVKQNRDTYFNFRMASSVCRSNSLSCDLKSGTRITSYCLSCFSATFSAIWLLRHGFFCRVRPEDDRALRFCSISVGDFPGYAHRHP